MKTLLSILVLIPLLASAQIRTVTPSGGGIQPADRTPFLTALGGTTAGRALFQMPNPSAIRYVRINADNSISMLNAGDFLTATGAASATTTRAIDKSDFNFVMEGDSIFQGVTAGGATVGNYLQDIIGSRSFFSGRATVTDYATAGNQIGTIISDYATQSFTKRPSANGGRRAIYCLLIGTNDSSTPATQLTNAATLLAHCATARADGFEVWLCTLLPRSSVYPGNNWDAFNRVLRDSDSYDKLIDFNALFKDATNTALMGDALHPTNLGYILMADYLNGRAWSDAKREPLNFGSLGKQDANAVSIGGGSIAGMDSILSVGYITRKTEGAVPADFNSFANGAGGSRQWVLGHNPNSGGSMPANSLRTEYFNGTAWEGGLSGFAPDGRIVGKQLRLTNTPVYANDAAADADSVLLSGQFYKLTGSRILYQKP